MQRIGLLCVVLCLKLYAIESFNLATKPNLIITEPLKRVNNSQNSDSSYFGYSILLRKQSVLIGAPRALTEGATRRPIETGAIYRYDFASRTAKPFNLENVMEFLNLENLQQNVKHQWLGMSMDGGSRDEQPLIVCAPLKTATKMYNNAYMHGICYWTNTTLEGESQDRVTHIVSPFSAKGQEQRQNMRKESRSVTGDLRYGEFGFSVQITPNGNELISGSPGVNNWGGKVVHYNLLSHETKSTKAAIQSSAYKGYAVGCGYFNVTNLAQLSYVFTMPNPNSESKMGQAQIYYSVGGRDANSFILQKGLTGDEYGDYFGYSLLVADLNADRIDDILIGAPHRTVNNIFEAGAVYMHINRRVTHQLNFRNTVLESPFPTRGHFGTSLGKLGDINGDGYNDIAIGAPYAGDNGNGAVAIYFGGPNGLETQPRQILHVSEQLVGSGGMFGYGLSRGVDTDHNDYPDLAVGAPNADKVFIYKSYPVVKINATILQHYQNIPINTTSLKFDICINIQTNSTKFRTQELLLDLSVATEEKRINVAHCISKNAYVAGLTPQCQTCNATLIPDDRYIFVPITMKLTYRLKNDGKAQKELEFCDHCAVVDPAWPNTAEAQIQYLHNCKGSICSVDLQLRSVDMPDNLILGMNKTLPLKYVITNVGEEAYNTQLIIKSTLNVPIAKMPSECLADFEFGWHVKCSIANRRAFKDTTELEISLDLSKVVGVTEVGIDAIVSSTGEERKPFDNRQNDTVKLTTSAEIWITEIPTNKIFAVTDEKENVSVSMTFEIKNIGPSPLSLFHLIVDFPIGDGNRIYISNYSAQTYFKDLEYPLLDFETSSPVSPTTLNTTEVLYLNQLPENHTTFVSCQSSKNSKSKMSCALKDVLLTNALYREENITLVLYYEMNWENAEQLLLDNNDYLAHVAMVNFKPDTPPNGILSIKTHFKGAIFKKNTKRNLFWIYLAAIIGGILLLIALILLLRKLGFFKRLTKEEMAKNLNEKLEKARMKEDLDVCIAEVDADDLST
ncbi:integrin alpha-PS3 [Zeugodacus cucurbitae]|nr:integrin alpha-PS3 [Zeugodacus cucurbitae]